MSKEIVPVAEKYLLTINEAASYFNIGAKKMRRLAEEYTGEFSLYSGNILLIIRTKFEKFLSETSTVWRDFICCK